MYVVGFYFVFAMVNWLVFKSKDWIAMIVVASFFLLLMKGVRYIKKEDNMRYVYETCKSI